MRFDFYCVALLPARFSVEVDCLPSANNSCNQDMDSSSSSSSSSSPRPDPQEEGEVDGLQQSKQEQQKQYPLFFIKPIDSQGQGIEKKKRLEDLGEHYYYHPSKFKLPTCPYVSIAKRFAKESKRIAAGCPS